MLNYFKAFLGYHLENEEGQGMVEYILIIALIALVVIIIFPAVSAAITAAFQSVVDAL